MNQRQVVGGGRGRQEANATEAFIDKNSAIASTLDILCIALTRVCPYRCQYVLRAL